ncbi:MAG TPA: cytosine permease [Streptosporangiaceae bacterium]
MSPGARWGRPASLFGLWAGAVANVEYLLYGCLAVLLFGLSFGQAVAIICVGNLSYLLTGLASLQGPQAGTTTFTVSRAPFGPRGNKVPTLFNWATQVGFEVEGLSLIVFAGLALAARGGLGATGSVKIIAVLAAVAIQAVLPVLGHAAVLKVLRVLAVPFAVLFVIMAVITVPKAHLAAGHGAGWGAMTVFLALVIAGGGLGWTENANDYSRYLPAGTSPRRIVAAVALGAAIPSALLEILGAAVATGVPGASSVTGLTAGFPGWFIVPYLTVAIIQLFAINTLDLYSSGVTLQSLIPGLSRLQCVTIDTVVAGGLTAAAVFSSRFFALLSDFVLFIIVWLGPWCAIYLTDWLLRRGRYDPAALLDVRGGRYFRRGGVHWPAIIAQAAGMAAAMLWLNAATPYVSVLSRSAGLSDFSVFTGFAVGGIVYWLLARRAVRAEGAATGSPGGR